MATIYEELKAAYDSISDRIPFKPRVGVVLGSGLGVFAENLKVEAEISYSDIKGFPVSTVEGHAGEFIFAHVNDVPVVCMNGRVHYYEGYEMDQVVMPVRLMKLMGIETYFITNATGGIRRGFTAGSLMLITGQIATLVPSPLRGPNVSELGVRFPDMSHIYDEDLQQIAREASVKLNIPLKEGVYLQTPGPQYESPEEIEVFRGWGADVVGMSSACEAIAAKHMGLKVIGISCISNLAAGISPTPLTMEEVLEAGKEAAPRFSALVKEIIEKL